MGVAKKAILHAVKVLDDNGSGYLQGIFGGMDWVAANAIKPAVMSMSLGGRGNSEGYREIIKRTKEKGITVVVAAGNDNMDACMKQPAFVPEAITVGSTDNRDRRSHFSNYGRCVDIW